MGKIQLGLAVRDMEYTRRLAEYVRSGPFRDRCQLVAFTNAEACRHYIKQGFPMELVAGEPALLEELSPDLAQTRQVALVGRLGESKLQEETLRYQALPQLLQSLLERNVAALAGKVIAGSAIGGYEEGPVVIGVSSVSGGVGVTALSLHLAHGAGSMGLHTCYLNLERWNTANSWLDGHHAARGGGLSELLYEIKAHGKADKEWLGANRNHNATLKGDYLTGFSHPGDRENLTAEDAVALIDYIAGSGRYKVIVVDLDHELCELHLSVLERCNYSFYVVADDASSLGKLSLAWGYANHKWGERHTRMLENNWVVRNRTAGGGTFALPQSYRSAPGGLPDVEVWRQGRRGKLLESPAFRAASAELLKLALKNEVARYVH
ncbi:P-loop NTPase family protein [Paenibacillus sp. CAU 1782]